MRALSLFEVARNLHGFFPESRSLFVFNAMQPISNAFELCSLRPQAVGPTTAPRPRTPITCTLSIQLVGLLP